MRLIDQVLQMPQSILLRERDGARTYLPGADRLAPLLAECPLRYVLADDVTGAATMLAFEDNHACLARCMDIIHVPAHAVWLEYEHAVQYRLLRELGMAPATSVRPQRLGFYIKASEGSARRGEVWFVWEAQDGLGPEVSPISARFDFDDEGFSAAQACPTPLARPDGPEIRWLDDRLALRIDADWLRYYEARCNAEELRASVTRCALPVFCDLPVVLALFLLTMAQGAVRQTSIDLSALNRSRARTHKPPLADHIELRMALGARNEHAEGEPSEYGRSSPRLHMVRGHVVRRHDRLFWRTAHMRGDAAKGAIKSRTLSMHLAETD